MEKKIGNYFNKIFIIYHHKTFLLQKLSEKKLLAWDPIAIDRPECPDKCEFIKEKVLTIYSGVCVKFSGIKWHRPTQDFALPQIGHLPVSEIPSFQLSSTGAEFSLVGILRVSWRGRAISNWVAVWFLHPIVCLQAFLLRTQSFLSSRQPHISFRPQFRYCRNPANWSLSFSLFGFASPL